MHYCFYILIFQLPPKSKSKLLRIRSIPGSEMVAGTYPTSVLSNTSCLRWCLVTLPIFQRIFEPITAHASPTVAAEGKSFKSKTSSGARVVVTLQRCEFLPDALSIDQIQYRCIFIYAMYPGLLAVS